MVAGVGDCRAQGPNGQVGVPGLVRPQSREGTTGQNIPPTSTVTHTAIHDPDFCPPESPSCIFVLLFSPPFPSGSSALNMEMVACADGRGECDPW